MQVTKEYMIEGSVVEYYGKIKGIEVYCLWDNDRAIIYYVHGNDVVAANKITADCSQNMGFIDDVTFENY